MPSIPRYSATLVALATLLTALGLLADLAQPSSELTIIYPATGLAFAVLWRFGVRWWPALFAAQFVVSLNASRSIAIAGVTTVIEVLTCLILLHLLLRMRVAPELPRIRDLLHFAGWTFLVTGLAGAMIAFAESFFGERSLAILARDGIYWWAGDAISIAVFTPLVTTWRTWPFLRPSRFRLVATLLILLLSLGLAITLGGDIAKSVLFLLLPIVIVNALLAGVAGAAASGALLTVTLAGFAMSGATELDLFIRLIFVATATLTGYVLGIVWTERDEAGQQLEHLARHDMLTGIFNRYEFENRLRETLDDRRGDHALLYLDLDQFKLVNDTCGHMAGDNMLKEVAQQLAVVLPPGATLGRLGGDEFGCLLPATDEASAVEIAKRVHDSTAGYRFRYGQSEFGVTTSIGITVFGNAPGDTSDSILSRADIACYLAKEEGHGATRVYRPADEAMLTWHAAIQEVSQVENALASGKLSLFCQQIVAISRRLPDPHLYEVLLRLYEGGRWQSASEFLPIVQRFGLMERIDRWVLEKTCAFLASSGDPALRLSVNISGATLNQVSFFEFAMSMPERHGIDASRICLEVTEGVAIQRLRQGVEAMHKLRARGFDLALDDFGAGVASFGYLHELPVSMVKLDGRFVRDLRSDPAAEVIIDSLVRIAEIRGVACVAEWVENEESIEHLRRLGVGYAQGYFISMPKPLSSLLVTQETVVPVAPAVAVGR